MAHVAGLHAEREENKRPRQKRVMAKTVPATRRSAIQRLESLQRAGITHLPKATKRADVPPQQGSSHPAPAIAKRPDRVETGPRNSAAVATVGVPASCAGCASHAPHVPIPGASGEGRAAALARTASEVALCRRCAELARSRTQTVFGVGNPDARLVFCGEAPGADEDRQGEPFVGRAGQLLTDIIVKGMKIRREDVYILNILRCRPPGNRTPSPDEAANCREFLDRQLAIIQPKFICCLGAVAAQNLLGSDETIGRLRGRVHDLRGVKVICTYHPAYLLRNPNAKRFVWDDIKMLMAEMAQDVGSDQRS
ncbi:MAG: uracil-DNA glycosylase [Thermoguttaceae bacterium]